MRAGNHMRDSHRNECVPRSNWREVSAEYSRTSDTATWTQAHQWNFDIQVGKATASEIRMGLALRPGDRVLEVGCGTGALMQLVLHDSQEGVGVDVSEPLVRQGERFGINTTLVKLAVAEAAHLPLPTHSFDKVFCFSIFHHFPDELYAEAATREMLRVCRPGGTIFIGDVCGVMERRRKLLVRCGAPAFLVDLLLWFLKPFKRTTSAACQRLFYRRSFFQHLLSASACHYSFLEPATQGRTTSNWRFNVRIWKHWSETKAYIAHVLAAVWSWILSATELAVVT